MEKPSAEDLSHRADQLMRKTLERNIVEKAEFWRRFRAFSIDGVILSAILSGFEGLADSDTEGTLAWVWGLIAIAVSVLYFGFFQLSA